MTRLILRQTVTIPEQGSQSRETDYTELGRNRLIKHMQESIAMSGISAYRLRKEGVCEVLEMGGVTIKYEILEQEDEPTPPEGPKAA